MVAFHNLPDPSLYGHPAYRVHQPPLHSHFTSTPLHSTLATPVLGGVFLGRSGAWATLWAVSHVNVHCLLHTAQCIICIAHCTQHTVHCTLQTLHCRPRVPLGGPVVAITVHFFCQSLPRQRGKCHPAFSVSGLASFMALRPGLDRQTVFQKGEVSIIKEMVHNQHSGLPSP